MAIRNVLKSDDELLRKKSREVTLFDKRIVQLVEDMIETLTKANGLGLAAPQVGVLKRIIIVEVEGKFVEVINPIISEAKGLQLKEEGCLSCPGFLGIKKRPATVTVKGFDRYGKPVKYTGVEIIARAFCHEIDHLNGILIMDNPYKVINTLGE